MKRSGNHKHNRDNPEGLHTHDYEELGEQGLKLLVKGKLKDMPNFSFKKPKSEKQKRQAKEKRDKRKADKKEELNEMINEIERNMEKFQSKKQIASQSVGQQIPIYIPQYTPPTASNLNIQNLSEINDMILKKENELKQYYEQEFQRKWSEIEQQYTQLEDEVMRNQQEDAFRPVIPVPTQPAQLTEQQEQDFEPISDFERDFVKVDVPLSATQEFEYEPSDENLEDKIIGLLDIFDDEVLSKFKQADPKLDTLEKLNEEQQEIINSKQNQLDQLIELQNNLNQALNLDRQSIDRLEKELMEKIQEINELQDENLKIKKMKEAEILSIQLDGANNIAELNEQLDEVLQEKDKVEKELENLKLMNIERPLRPKENDLIDDNISPAEQQLISRDLDNDYRTEKLRKFLPNNLIPRQNNRLQLLYDTISRVGDEIGTDELNNRINIILSDNPNISQRDFILEINKQKKSIIEMFQEEEQKQLQIIKERAEEAENEEKMNMLINIEEKIDNIKQEIIENNVSLTQKETEISNYENEMTELIDEFRSLILTYETALEDADINNISEINKIDDERERENLLALNKYVNETKNNLEPAIKDIKEKIFELKSLSDEIKNKISLAEQQQEELQKQLQIVSDEIL